MSFTPAANFGAALRVIDDVWSELSTNPFFLDQKSPLERIPEVSLAAAARRSTLGRDLLAQIQAIDIDLLPADLPVTLEIARQTAERWTCEEDWYWLLFDPAGIGFYTMYAAAPYGGAHIFSVLAPRFRSFGFVHRSDGDRYVGLVRDYGRLVRQMLDRTQGQAERAIYMPRPQLEQGIALISGLRSGATKLLTPDVSRLPALGAGELIRRISDAIHEDVMPAFDAFVSLLESRDYAASSTESVGLSQYPGGREAYAGLVRLHTTLDLSVDEVHAAGLQQMAHIQSQIREFLDGIGFGDTPEAYLEQIKADPRWRASDPGDIGLVFQRYIDRIAPHLNANFNFRPEAGQGVAPLPATLSASMTFGYYTPPSPMDDRGVFLFNAANLAQAPLNTVAALTYHELAPGHHFHLASQFENWTLHPLRRMAFINAFQEGWAEYAATLAGELGMYSEPEERFGRLMTEAFLACRLVVDSGMNALGWSLEEAREYLHKYAFISEQEIRSETIRYSCDIPGQALVYKLGETVLYEARERMRAALGDRFDIRDFHDAVLKPGALPLPLVQEHVDTAIQSLTAAD